MIEKEQNTTVERPDSGIPKPSMKQDHITDKKPDAKNEETTWKKLSGVKTSKDENIQFDKSRKMVEQKAETLIRTPEIKIKREKIPEIKTKGQTPPQKKSQCQQTPYIKIKGKESPEMKIKVEMIPERKIKEKNTPEMKIKGERHRKFKSKKWKLKE